MNDPHNSPVFQERRSMLALVGDGNAEPSDILASILRHTFEERMTVTVHTRGYAQDLIVAASRRPYDLFVLSLTSISQRGITLDATTCIDRAAELVPYLKQTYHKPVVIVAGRYSGAALHWLEQAGADVILPMPFTLEQFADLVGSCVQGRPVGAPGF